ncbi:MAG TPA: hypothetical protein VFC56_10425 [Stellaceae bacterium]|nr:hypothetical protein [Stellaceae bacterium]
MNRSLIVGAAFAASLGLSGFAQAQTRIVTPVPPATDFHGADLMIDGNADPALRYLGNGILVYDLRGNKMVNCAAAGLPAAGSVGSPTPFHPCR